MNKLQTHNAIDKKRLDNTHWLASLLREAARLELISKEDQQSIQEQMMQLMVFLATRYTSGASTSIRAETAQSFMESAAYSIGHTLKRLPDTNSALTQLHDTALRTLYDQGQAQLRDLLSASKKQYAVLLKNSMPLISCTWQSTVNNGLAEFFAAYDVYDAAQDSPGLIDYPLALPLEDACGIEYIHRYLKRVLIEDDLIRHWPVGDINGLIRAGGAVDAPINVFSLVMVNALGDILCGRRAETLSLSGKDRNSLRHKLNDLAAAPMRRLLRKTTNTLCKYLNIQNADARCYMSDTVASIVPSIKNALETNTLQRMFLSIKEKPKATFFHDTPRMDDAQFRALADEIAACRYSSERLELIKTHVASIADLIDIFEVHCLTRLDIREALETLDDDGLAMVLAISFESAPDSLHTSDTELVWRSVLKEYFGTLEELRQRQIRILSRNIKFI